MSTATEAIPPFTVLLPCVLTTGMILRIDFTCKEKINKNFQVKLEDKQGQNVILFVRYKSGSKKWVFNTKENGHWHSEEALILNLASEVRLLPNNSYSFTIKIQNDIFAIGCSVVTSDEKSEESRQNNLKQDTDLASHINNYRIRQNLEVAEYLKIKGDVIVTNICIQTPTETIPVKLPTNEFSASMKMNVSSTGVTIRDDDDQEFETERRRRKLESIAEDMLSAEAIVVDLGGASSSYGRGKSSSTGSKQEEPINLVRVGDKWVPETKHRGSSTKRQSQSQIRRKTENDVGISAVTPVISNEEIRSRSLEMAEEIREKVRLANEKRKKSQVDSQTRTPLGRKDSARSDSSGKFEALPSKSKAFLGMISTHMMDTDLDEKPKYRDRRTSSKLVNVDTASSRVNVEDDSSKQRTKEAERTYQYYKEPQCWCSIL